MCHVITATQVGILPYPLLQEDFVSGFTISSGPSLGKVGEQLPLFAPPRSPHAHGDATVGRYSLSYGQVVF